VHFHWLVIVRCVIIKSGRISKYIDLMAGAISPSGLFCRLEKPVMMFHPSLNKVFLILHQLNSTYKWHYIADWSRFFVIYNSNNNSLLFTCRQTEASSYNCLVSHHQQVIKCSTQHLIFRDQAQRNDLNLISLVCTIMFKRHLHNLSLLQHSTYKSLWSRNHLNR
jgi:hypothetical protein